ncbi:MAG: hypothetical protein FWD82_04330 [Defluviitaleaceae bacterium]|nr:hypothetical protein [Defluviitaleaceae bacterium]
MAHDYEICGCMAHISKRKTKKRIVMRHDVDKYPIRAYDIAKIEHDNKVYSTFFFRVFSDEYNIFGYETMAIIRDIEKMGHEIGYHAEPVDVSAAHADVSAEQAFTMGKKALELLLMHGIQGAASHREATGNNNLYQFFGKKELKELGLVYEAYDESKLSLFTHSTYITDGYEWRWRIFENGILTNDERCLCQLLEDDREGIYCLTHPHSWYGSHLHRVNY